MTDIWTVTCLFRQPNTSIQFQFNSQDHAEKTYASINAYRVDNPIETVTDSYGAEAFVDCTQVIAVIKEHFNRKLDAQREIELLKAHANAKLQREATTDPLLRIAAAVGNGLVMPRQ